MDDVLGYAGKRVIVTGAVSGVGAATAAILVELGAEVHTIDARKPAVGGLASFTEADLDDPAQVEAALRKIGSVVNAFFDCAPRPTLATVLDSVVSLMVSGAAIVGLAADAADATESETKELLARAPSLRGAEIRVNRVVVRGDAPDDAQAWPLVFLNSPRALHVTGNALLLEPRVSTVQD